MIKKSELTFEEVLPYAKQGYKIRRKIWGKAYIEMYKYTDFTAEFRTMFGNPVRLSSALFENDWEIIDD
ncbi:MAG: hypothetical protein IJ184_07390 [Alphaproteobacteria bacterium]|nr:hypothetical protein [Alphaproteobacteria bacterium]